MGVFPDHLVQVDLHLLIHFARVGIGIGHMQEIADSAVSTTMYLAVIFVKIPLMYSYIIFLYCLINICPFPQTGVIFLNASEHLFHIRLGEVNQDRTAMRAVIGVITLGQLIDQIACRVIVQRVVGLDGAFAGHHDGHSARYFLMTLPWSRGACHTSHRCPTRSLLPSSRSDAPAKINWLAPYSSK